MEIPYIFYYHLNKFLVDLGLGMPRFCWATVEQKSNKINNCTVELFDSIYIYL